MSKVEIGPISAQWLAGVYEISGQMSFHKAIVKGEVRAYPYIQSKNENPRAIAVLKHVIGASNNDPTTMSVKGKKAIDIGLAIKPFAPSRKPAINAYEDWLAVNDFYKRWLFAQLFLELEHQRAFPTAVEYSKLLEYPAFVAGLIDFGGNFYNNISSVKSRYRDAMTKRHKVGLSIQSPQLGLIEALHSKFLGSQPIKDGKSYLWQAQRDDSLAMFEFAHRYIRVAKASWLKKNAHN